MLQLRNGGELPPPDPPALFFLCLHIGMLGANFSHPAFSYRVPWVYHPLVTFPCRGPVSLNLLFFCGGHARTSSMMMSYCQREQWVHGPDGLPNCEISAVSGTAHGDPQKLSRACAQRSFRRRRAYCMRSSEPRHHCSAASAPCSWFKK